MVSLLTTGIAISAVFLLYLLYHSFSVTRFPSAPGPTLATISRSWYAWKVWKGNFEIWNIKQHEISGKIVRVAPNMYSIDDINAMKTIYGVSSNMPKSDWYTVWGQPGIANHNLFSALDRQFHGQMRRKVAHMYSMSSVKQYEPHVDACMSVLLRQFDKLEVVQEVFDLQRWMQSYAFDVIGEITFSSRFGFMESGAQDIDGIIKRVDALNSFCTLLGIDRFLFPLVCAKFGIPVTALEHWVQKLSQSRHHLIDKPKESRAEDFYSKVETVRTNDPEAITLYRADSPLIMNMAAGSDTTSISLTAILFYLAKYPETLKKLRREIINAAANGDVADPISFEQAQRLPYLSNVIKEGMRLHPATGLPLWRVVQKPGELIGDKYFPAGASVGINPWVAHRNQKIFGTDAHEFRPERWDPDATPAEQLACMERYYMPFGAGTRTCIGKNISLLEMSKLIPELVRRYDIRLVSQEMKSVNHWFVKQNDLFVRIVKVRDD